MAIHAPTLLEGAVLLRLPAAGARWPETLPPVPDGYVVTVTLGHAGLRPPASLVTARGYRLAGAASDARPLGDVIDLLVGADLRTAEPSWWAAVLGRATRAFDLRHGPVQRVLAAELDLHARALDST